MAGSTSYTDVFNGPGGRWNRTLGLNVQAGDPRVEENLKARRGNEKLNFAKSSSIGFVVKSFFQLQGQN